MTVLLPEARDHARAAGTSVASAWRLPHVEAVPQRRLSSGRSCQTRFSASSKQPVLNFPTVTRELLTGPELQVARQGSRAVCPV